MKQSKNQTKIEDDRTGVSVPTLIQAFDENFFLFGLTAHIDSQDKVSETWRNQNLWTRISILNVARMGKFSSDPAIQEYCQDIWNVKSVSPDIL